MVSLESPNTKVTHSPAVCHWIAAIRLSRLIGLLLLILVLVPLFTHYYLSKFIGDSPVSEIHHKGIQLEDLDSIKAVDLKTRIEEMIRIKTSVSNELRDLENRRQRLQVEITALSQRVEDLKQEYSHQQIELERLRVSVQQAQYAQKEVQEKTVPHISSPKRILPSLEDSVLIALPSVKASRLCRIHLCFDFSRCSLTSGFPVYFYHPDDFHSVWDPIEQAVKSAVTEALNMNVHITFDPAIACVYVVLISNMYREKHPQTALENYLKTLSHWNGDGRNHILLHLVSSFNTTNIFSDVNIGRAIIVQSHYTASQFREGFDLIVPPFISTDKSNKWGGTPLYSPARRKFLLSFQGEYRTSKTYVSNDSRKLLSSYDNTFQDDTDILDHGSVPQPRMLTTTVLDGDYSEDFIVDVLKEMQTSTMGDNFFFQFSCAGSSVKGIDSEWLLCGTQNSRTTLLSESTFSLIISPSNFDLISTPQFHVRIHEALKTGAIPVILGSHMYLPFHEFIDWKRVAVLLPKSRVTELHYYLRAFTDADILAFRRQGRLLWERYLASPQQVINTVIAVIRNRIQIFPPAAQEESSPSVFNTTFQPLKVEFAAVQDADPEENLGPIEQPFPSPSFVRNMTYTNAQQYFVWNDLGDPFTLYPHTPFDPVLPSESKFVGSSFGFRPIGQGAGGSGKEFSEALGGNFPREQFTIVMLTYEREAVLIDSLQRLRGLPYLNKVLVVWNSARPPAPDLRWPEIGVPIQVVKAKKNSLNNRFLPYDSVETEAVLSVDDDAHLRHDEIVFGFRYNCSHHWQGMQIAERGIDMRAVNLNHEEPVTTVCLSRLLVEMTLRGIPTTRQTTETGARRILHKPERLTCSTSLVVTESVWREARDRIVGFPGRYHAWDIQNGGWLYNSNYSCELSMVLTGAAFFHKYYSYLYSYSMPQTIRDKVDEYMNCEDIAMNFLVSHITRKPPIKVTSRWTFRCPGCPISLSEEDSHFQERHKCINYFTQIYGYMPLLNTQFRVDSVLFKTRIPHDKQKCFKFI